MQRLPLPFFKIEVPAMSVQHPCLTLLLDPMDHGKRSTSNDTNVLMSFLVEKIS